jgi:hypothetical protein
VLPGSVVQVQSLIVADEVAGASAVVPARRLDEAPPGVVGVHVKCSFELDGAS